MNIFLKILLGIAIFDVLVYIFVWYDIVQDRLKLAEKFQKLKETFTEEE